MPKKISRSDIPLASMPVVSSTIRKCRVCLHAFNKKEKYVVFNELHIPLGYSCKYCYSIYLDNDILIMIGNEDNIDVYGET
jgi:hypothetical protein